MNVIKVDSEKCTGCKTCYKACWIDVIRWDESAKRPVIAYPEDCVECNFCEISCPVDALTVVVDYGRPWPSVYE
jgi:NAD-dependent dihydropyrimidine dehydrogenase PreA subunit